MAKSGYSVTTEGAVALSAATAKTIIGVKSGATTANFGVDWIGYSIAFDGIAATAVPVFVELCTATWGANPPGTNSTSVTVVQKHGRLAATGFTGGKTWTTEPTTLVAFYSFLLTPNGGTVIYNWPLGQSPDSPLGEGFAIRCTAPAIVNARASMEFERA